MSMKAGTVPPEVLSLFPNPQPVRGCDICAALASQRLKCMDRKSPEYNPARAVELSHEIRQHPHGR